MKLSVMDIFLIAGLGLLLYMAANGGFSGELNANASVGIK